MISFLGGPVLNALPGLRDSVFLRESSLRTFCKRSAPVAKMLNAKVLEESLRPHSDMAPPVTHHVTKPKNPTLPVPTTACNIYLSFRLLRFPFIYSLFLFNFASHAQSLLTDVCMHICDLWACRAKSWGTNLILKHVFMGQS